MAARERLFTAELLADPYPTYRRLRAAPPAVDPHFGELLLTRYGDAVAALKHPCLSSRQTAEQGLPLPAVFQRAGAPLIRFLSRQMLFSDPPDHTRLRGLVVKAFTPRMVERMRQRVQHLTDGLLDRLLAKSGPVDLIREFAQPLPLRVISEMLGVDSRDYGRFKLWSADLGLFIGGSTQSGWMVTLRGARGMRGLKRYFTGLVRRRRRGEPVDDLLGALIAAEEQGDQLSEEELLANCVLLLAAGHETTTNLIGNGLRAFLAHPEQAAALREEPALLEGAVEEVLRYDSPVQWTGRVALDSVDINGMVIPVGQRVAICLGAANHDPEQFSQPETFDIRRRENRHLAFSHGIHFCLGAALARMEGQISLDTVLRRCPDMRPASHRLEWQPNFTLRGLRRLPAYLR